MYSQQKKKTVVTMDDRFHEALNEEPAPSDGQETVSR